MLIWSTGAYRMHNWGSRTNGPQGIWGNRGYGSQHVLIPGIAVGDRGAYYRIPYYAILFHTIPYYSINRETRFFALNLLFQDLKMQATVLH